MARQQIICGVDVGNSNIKTVIAEMNRELLAPQIIGYASTPSNGMRRGIVVDMEETISNIGESVNKASAMAGTKVNRAYVSINGLHIKTQMSHGIIAVSRADNEISQFDIDRVIDAASAISLPSNREIIHIIPRHYIIDGQEYVKNPLGMRGVRLEADVILVEGLAPYIKNLARCFNANDIEVAELVYSPLATAKAVLDKHQREHGVLNIDFGGGISSLAVFHEGDLVHTAVLPIGSKHITNDIAVAFRTSIDRAEAIKKEHGSVDQNEKTKKEPQVDLAGILDEDNFVVPKKQISKIVDARVSELFDMITAELKKVSASRLLAAGAVLAGGGSNLDGLLDFTKNRLKLFTSLGGKGQMPELTSRISDASYATAIGLVVWGSEKETPDSGFSLSNPFSNDKLKKAGKWLKNFLP